MTKVIAFWSFVMKFKRQLQKLLYFFNKKSSRGNIIGYSIGIDINVVLTSAFYLFK